LILAFWLAFKLFTGGNCDLFDDLEELFACVCECLLSALGQLVPLLAVLA
jgi:hypothetical protein